MNRHLLALVTTAALAGCVNIASVPDQWGAVARGDATACPLLAGAYANKGENADSGKSVFLAQFLARPGQADHFVYATPEIRLSLENEAVLVAYAIRSGKEIEMARLRRDAGDFACANGELTLKARKQAGGLVVAAIVNSGTAVLAIEPGFLRIRQSDTGAMFIPVPPFVIPGATIIHARFARIADGSAR